MKREQAEKFMDTLTEANKMVKAINAECEEENVYTIVPDNVRGIEKIADALQLTRTYAPYDGFMIIRIVYKGIEFIGVEKN